MINYFFQMAQTMETDESEAQPEPGQDHEPAVAEANPIRDPGVSEDVWQELEIVKMAEQFERERIRQEEEEAKR